jgi:uncharacterized protein YprB with RNaseH-like and TPR domain
VERTSAGAVVWLESQAEVAVDRGALRTLPYSVGTEQPFVCLDLETTGLATAAGTVAFLVGLGSWDGSRLTVRQLLLPDHADEDAFLDALVEALPSDAWLVTYNGRTFDWPLLVARFRLHRRSPPPFAGHLDLLPVARQLWKHRLGNARLATVEDAVCAVVRDGDLPGALIPERYFSYLRSRRGELLRDVVEHNRQDIVSLGLLLTVLGGYASDASWARLQPGDLGGLARGFLARGRIDDALRCVEAALAADAWSLGVTDGASVRRHLSAERARLLARLGRRTEAHAAWLEIATRGGPGAALAWLHVARHREHVERDVAGALAACREAASVAERARLWDRPMHAIESDLARRLTRLRRKSFARRSFSRAA